MSPIVTASLVSAAFSVVSFIASLGAAMFVAGSRWGRVEADIKLMSDRLAKIEGMFTLKLKQDE